MILFVDKLGGGMDGLDEPERGGVEEVDEHELDLFAFVGGWIEDLGVAGPLGDGGEDGGEGEFLGGVSKAGDELSHGGEGVLLEVVAFLGVELD